MISSNVDINLGLTLLEHKLITEQQLKAAINRHKIKGGYLSQHLVELSYVRDVDITACLTCHLGFCYVSIDSYTIAPDTLKMIPPQFIYDFCVFPMEKNDKLLTVAMSDPLNKGVIEILRRVTHCEIIVFISTRSEIKEAIQRQFGYPCANFQLDKYHEDDVLRDNLQQQIISNGLYSGLSKRRYQRLYKELSGQYYIYPNIFKSKIKNISMSGLLFETHEPIMVGSTMAVDVQLSNRQFISGVVEVIRSDKQRFVDLNADEGQDSYETGVFFNFLSNESQDILADHIKKVLSM